MRAGSSSRIYASLDRGDNALSPRRNSIGRRVAVSAVMLASIACAQVASADTLVSWDIPYSTASSAPVYGSALSGLTVSAITAPGLTQNSSSTSWRWANLLNSSTVNPASMTNKDFEWTFTTGARTTASITQITGGTVSPSGTGWSTSVQLWAQTVDNTGTSSWTQVGSSLATTGSAVAVSMDSAFFSVGSPYNVNAGTTVTFKLVPLGATGGSSSPKIAWTAASGSASGADVSLIGTTSGSAWNMSWAGGSSGSWNYSSANWQKDGAGSAQAFVAGDNATISSNGAVITVDAGGVTSGAVSVTNSSGTVSIGGGSLSASSLTKSAAGTLVLSASNAFATGVTASGGVVEIGHGSSLGSATATIDGATLRATVAALSTPIAIGAGGATIDTGSGLALNGAITGAGNTLTATGAGVLTLGGAVGTNKNGIVLSSTGATPIVFSGAGAKEFAGTNSVAGTISGTNQTININGNAVFGGAGTLVVNGGTISTVFNSAAGTGGSATIGMNVQFANAVTLNAASGKILKFDTGILTGSGTLTTQGSGGVQFNSTGTSTFGGSIVNSTSLTASAPSLVGVSSISTSSGLTIDGKTAFSNPTIAAAITGAGSVTKTSDGDITLTGVNTFSGGLTINNAGTVYVNAASGLGAGSITSGSAGRVGLAAASASSVTIPNNLNTGASGVQSLAFAAGSGKTIVLTGTATGSGQLKVSGGGDLDLTQLAANSSTGGIEIGTGRILTNLTSLGSGTMNFGTGVNSYLVPTVAGTLSMPITIGSASGNGYTANINTNGNALTITSVIADKVGNANGGLLNKLGAGSLVLAAANTYTGATTVSAGRLAVNGSLDAASAVTVLSGATLGGNGTIGGITTVAGIVAPGNSIGTLTIANDVVWNGAATAGSNTDWVFELGASSTSDLLAITGGASDFIKDSTSGSVYRFDFGNSAEQGTFTLVTWGGITNFSAGDFSYTGLPTGNTATFSLTSNALNVIIVPEPTALLLAALGAGGLWLAGRRRAK